MILQLVQVIQQEQLTLHQLTTLLYEGNETATIAISGVSGADATESGSQSVSVTITENESAPTVTLTVKCNFDCGECWIFNYSNSNIIRSNR
jgi:hypothetical protein